MCNFLKNWRLAQLLVCLMLVALAPLAQANVLVAGSTATPDVFNPIVGTTLATFSGMLVAPGGDFTTSFTTNVISDPANNFCANCLDFVYAFTNNGPDDNGRYTMGVFSTWQTNVSYVAGTGSIPNEVERSANGNNIAFDFAGSANVMPGQSTVLLVIETNATGFSSGHVSAQNDVTANGSAFQPAVPEPSSLALLGSGVLGLVQLVRRKLL